jgi:hypothetical protein
VIEDEPAVPVTQTRRGWAVKAPARYGQWILI